MAAPALGETLGVQLGRGGGVQARRLQKPCGPAPERCLCAFALCSLCPVRGGSNSGDAGCSSLLLLLPLRCQSKLFFSLSSCVSAVARLGGAVARLLQLGGGRGETMDRHRPGSLAALLGQRLLLHGGGGVVFSFLLSLASLRLYFFLCSGFFPGQALQPPLPKV